MDNGVAVHSHGTQKMQATAAVSCSKEKHALDVGKGIASMGAVSAVPKVNCGDISNSAAGMGTTDDRPSDRNDSHFMKQDVPRATKKKGNGHIRQCAQSLKRIARLSVKIGRAHV